MEVENPLLHMADSCGQPSTACRATQGLGAPSGFRPPGNCLALSIASEQGGSPSPNGPSCLLISQRWGRVTQRMADGQAVIAALDLSASGWRPAGLRAPPPPPSPSLCSSPLGPLAARYPRPSCLCPPQTLHTWISRRMAWGPGGQPCHSYLKLLSLTTEARPETETTSIKCKGFMQKQCIYIATLAPKKAVRAGKKGSAGQLACRSDWWSWRVMCRQCYQPMSLLSKGSAHGARDGA